MLVSWFLIDYFCSSLIPIFVSEKHPCTRLVVCKINVQTYRKIEPGIYWIWACSWSPNLTPHTAYGWNSTGYKKAMSENILLFFLIPPISGLIAWWSWSSSQKTCGMFGTRLIRVQKWNSADSKTSTQKSRQVARLLYPRRSRKNACLRIYAKQKPGPLHIRQDYTNFSTFLHDTVWGAYKFSDVVNNFVHIVQMLTKEYSWTGLRAYV